MLVGGVGLVVLLGRVAGGFLLAGVALLLLLLLFVATCSCCAIGVTDVCCLG